MPLKSFYVSLSEDAQLENYVRWETIMQNWGKNGQFFLETLSYQTLLFPTFKM